MQIIELHTNSHQACIINEIPQISVMILTSPNAGKSTKKAVNPNRSPPINVASAP
jgi:hypothetical protein